MRKPKQKKNLFTIAVKGLAANAFLAMLICIVLMVYSQTPVGKQQIARQIESQIRHLAPDAEVINLEGHFPWRWKISKIKGTIPETCFVEIDNLNLKLSVLSLLFKPIRLSFVEIEKINVTLFEHRNEDNHLLTLDPSQNSPAKQFHEMISKLPSLAIDRFNIQECILSTPESENPNHYYAFRGRLDLRPNDKKLKGELLALVPHEQKKLWDFNLDLQNQERLILQITTFEPLSNDLAVRFGIPRGMNDFLFDLHAEGPISTINTLFNAYPNRLISPPITLQFKAQHAFQKENHMKLRMFVNPDRTIEISQIDMHLSFLDLQGHLKLAENFHPSQGFLEFNFKGSFAPSPFCTLNMPLKGQIEIDNHQLLARGYAKKWSIDDHIFHELNFTAKASHGLYWQGNFALASDSTEERLLCLSQFTYDASQFKLEGFRLEFPSLFINSETSFDLTTMLASGDLFAQTDSLNQIPCASLLPLGAGKAAFELKLQPIEEHQGVEWTLKAQEGTFESIRFDEINCKGSHEFASVLTPSLLDESYPAYFDLEGKKIYWKWNYFENLDWKIEKVANQYYHELQADGVAKKPFYLNAKWSYANHNQEHMLVVDQFEGSWMKLPILLEHPCQLSLKENELSLQGLDLKIGSGSIHGFLRLSENLFDGKVTTTHVPLSPFSSLSSDTSLEGTISSEWVIAGTATNPQGHAWLELEPTVLKLEDGMDQVVGKGSIQLYLDHNQLQGHFNMISAYGQYLEAQASIPLTTSNHLQKWRFSDDKPFSARVRVEGNIEELIPFLTFDAHRLEGKIDADLFLSKTLENPVIQGTLSFENGLYENISYGTQLKNISLKTVADRDRFIIEESSATDGKEGSLFLTGQIILSSSFDLQFDLFSSLQKLEVIKGDFAEACVSGKVHYQGTFEKAKLSGILQSEKIELKIPDKMTETIPHVDIEFIRLASRKTLAHSPKEKKNELLLDLDLTLKDKVFVSGRGLSSEWKGNLKIEGTADDVLPMGSLDLVRGKFLFTGKTFNLSEGNIIFNGKELIPYIHLEGNMYMSDLSVTVLLQGPLASPQLSFQSIPYLPTSSLLSRLLFNKDVSEINPVQAYQLAETLMSLSGSGVNILEAIQKSLGIDKLSLVTNENRADEVSVQIGKYLYNGVMVTLSQSASSSEVMVEVELKKGFIFQAETVEDDGKFTLKWNYNY